MTRKNEKDKTSPVPGLKPAFSNRFLFFAHSFTLHAGY